MLTREDTLKFSPCLPAVFSLQTKKDTIEGFQKKTFRSTWKCVLTCLWCQNCSNQLENIWEWYHTSIIGYLLLSGTNRSILWRDLSGSWKKRCKSLPLLSIQRYFKSITVLKHNYLPRISCMITTQWLNSILLSSLGTVDSTWDQL